MPGVICKVWNVSGGNNSSKGTRGNLKCSIDYVLNEEKTRYETTDPQIFRTLQNEANYVTRDIKTINRAYTAVIGLSSIDTAAEEMLELKEFHGKTEGRNALHGFISLEGKESELKNAGKLLLLADEVIREVFPGYQAILGVHTDTEHLHCHFIINSVGLNGKKIHQNDRFMQDILHPAVNRAVARYGLSINPEWEKEKALSKLSYKDQKIMARKAVNLAIEYASSFDEFIENLKKAGYVVNTGKHISIKNADMPKPMRTYQLGKEYSVEGITQKIIAKNMVPSHTSISVKPGEVSLKREAVKPLSIKKYKDMTKSEKEAVLKIIRRGKNPWQDEIYKNWQINKQQRFIAEEKNIQNIINAYTPNEGIDSAMKKIIVLQQELTKERKALKESQKPFKEPVRLYREMKKYEKRSFLYEQTGDDRYRIDYEKYYELLIRLTEPYHKTPQDMAEYVKECKDELAYARAVERALSGHYRLLKAYKETGHVIKVNESLLEKSGYYEAMDNARVNFHVSKDFILTNDKKEFFAHVRISPEVVDGKVKSVVSIQIVDKNGEIIDSKNSLEEGFSKWAYKAQKEYRFRDLKEYESLSEAVGEDVRRGRSRS